MMQASVKLKEGRDNAGDNESNAEIARDILDYMVQPVPSCRARNHHAGSYQHDASREYSKE